MKALLLKVFLRKSNHYLNLLKIFKSLLCSTVWYGEQAWISAKHKTTSQQRLAKQTVNAHKQHSIISEASM